MPETTNRRLARLLEPLAGETGFANSPMPGVSIARGMESIPRHPIVYKPGIIVLAQGRKRVWLGDEVFEYDANNYLVLAAPMPMECETFATAEEPLIALGIEVDPITVGELILEMGDVAGADPTTCVKSGAMTEDVIDATVRLAETLSSPIDARILGPQIVREIVYRVLRSENGDVLRLATANHSRFGHIARVLRRIHDEYDTELDVPSLARDANMGTSTFHTAFREVTSTSPVQYVKRIRLHRARTLLLGEGATAQDAARAVGYTSASQFSREYRRMFGVSPAADRTTSLA